jgi:3'(2'), 5'-bisphosphate nucleotidase
MQVAALLHIGSSLKICLMANGEADLFTRLEHTMEWDTAAGHAVLSVAGGYLTETDGRPLDYAKPDFVNFFVATGQAGCAITAQ